MDIMSAIGAGRHLQPNHLIMEGSGNTAQNGVISIRKNMIPIGQFKNEPTPMHGLPDTHR